MQYIVNRSANNTAELQREFARAFGVSLLSGYTKSMKTAISIPDDIFAKQVPIRLDRLEAVVDTIVVILKNASLTHLTTPQNWTSESDPTSKTDSEVVHVQRYMRENPELLHHGLSMISQTLANYAREAIRVGADGIFITTTTWSRDACTEEEYRVFGKPYDLAVYKAANEEGASFNVLHICRENIMFNLLKSGMVRVRPSCLPSRACVS